MDPHTRVIAGEKRQRFFSLIRQTYNPTQDQLIAVIRDRGYSARYRCAALRNLICSAPLAVTRGACYLERRRLVRQAYAV